MMSHRCDHCRRWTSGLFRVCRDCRDRAVDALPVVDAPRRKTPVEIRNIGDWGPCWVARVGRGDIGLSPRPTADGMMQEVWRTHGGDTPLLIFPTPVRR